MSNTRTIFLAIGSFVLGALLYQGIKVMIVRNVQSTTSSAPIADVSREYDSAAGAPSFGVSLKSAGLASGVVSEAAPFAPKNGFESNASAPSERLIIRSGQISLVVKEVPVVLKQIADFAARKGGFVVESNVYKNGLAPYGVITVRLPVKEFSQGVQEVKALGEVASESVHGTDVTEEFVDLDSRVRNLHATEDQFLLIMKQAVRIQDVLEVQSRLSNVRSEIEVIQGRMKFLRQSAELSSLTVNVSPDPSVLPVAPSAADEWKPIAVLKEALRSLRSVGTEIASGAIWVLVFFPVWVVGLIALWLLKKLIAFLLRSKNRHD